MRPVEQKLAHYLLSQSGKYTKGEVLERFAISYNTLRKIEAGSSLRLTLVNRLEDRLRKELSPARDEAQARTRKN